MIVVGKKTNKSCMYMYMYVHNVHVHVCTHNEYPDDWRVNNVHVPCVGIHTRRLHLSGINNSQIRTRD